jgi:hypothetical protein
MATLEHEQLLGGRAASVGDAHVFAAATGRRAWMLRLAGVVAGVLALGWLAALGLALLGALAFPGALPGAKAGGSAPDSVPSDPLRVVPAQQAPGSPAAAFPRGEGLARPVAPTTLSDARTAVTRVVSTRRPVTPLATTAPAVPAPVEAPAAPRQSSGRRGRTAPPGQTRRDQPRPRRAFGSGDTPAVTSTTPPGQAGSRAPNKG